MTTPTRETLAARLRELAYELNSDFVRQAADALAAMAWQPMDTAPKDVAVLVWCSHGQYVATLDERIHGKGIFGWSVDDNKHGPYALRGASPTHWMPLPPAPATGPQAGDAGTRTEDGR